MADEYEFDYFKDDDGKVDHSKRANGLTKSSSEVDMDVWQEHQAGRLHPMFDGVAAYEESLKEAKADKEHKEDKPQSVMEPEADHKPESETSPQAPAQTPSRRTATSGSKEK